MNWQQILEEFLMRVVEFQILIWIGVVVFGGMAIWEKRKSG